MHKNCEKGKKTMPALLNKVTVNFISDKPPLYWTNSRKGTLSQFVKMTRCIPKPLCIYAYTQPLLILMFLSFNIVTASRDCELVKMIKKTSYQQFDFLFFNFILDVVIKVLLAELYFSIFLIKSILQHGL